MSFVISLVLAIIKNPLKFWTPKKSSKHFSISDPEMHSTTTGIGCALWKHFFRTTRNNPDSYDTSSWKPEFISFIKRVNFRCKIPTFLNGFWVTFCIHFSWHIAPIWMCNCLQSERICDAPIENSRLDVSKSPASVSNITNIISNLYLILSPCLLSFHWY